MTITEYLDKHDMSVTDFARALGRPISTVYGWKTGRRNPSFADIPDLERVTKGAVTAEAFIPRAKKGKHK